MSVLVKATDYVSPASTSAACTLVIRLGDLLAQLEHDIDQGEKKEILAEIRQIRRWLIELEYEVLEGHHELVGDGC